MYAWFRLLLILIISDVCPSIALAAEQTIGSWTYGETKDEFNDQRNSIALTKSPEAKSMLSITCFGGRQLLVNFSPDSFIMEEANGVSDFQYRVDKNKAVKTLAWVVRSSAALSIEPLTKQNAIIQRDANKEGIAFLKQISSGATVVIGVSGVKSRFSLDGAGTQIKKVTDQCASIFKV